MLDIKFIRQNPNKVKEGCRAKQAKVDIDELLEVDKKRLETLQALEDMRAQKNKASKKIGETKKEKSSKKTNLLLALRPLERARRNKKIILEMKELDSNSDRLTQTIKELDEKFNALMLQVPNLPQDDVPVGKDASENVVLKEVGEKPKFDFKPKDYLELAERLDLVDVKRAAKVSGTRFGYLKGGAALLEFALIDLAFGTLTKDGFIPIVPPVMVKSEVARGMGYFEQADKEDAYYLPKDDLYLVGTSEQSIGVMHTNEVFEEKDLPKRYVGFSTCFRRESGSYGKDTN